MTDCGDCEIWIEVTYPALRQKLHAGTWIRIAQKLTVPNKTVCRVGYYIRKGGSPTGTAYARIRRVSDDGIIETSSDTVDVSTLTAAFVWHYFTFDSLVDEEVRISLEYNGGDAGNYIETYITNIDKCIGCVSRFDSSWGDLPSNYDLNIKIYVLDPYSCNTFDNQADCEACGCCWCEVDGILQCVDCPCPPLWKYSEVGLKGFKDCIIDYVISWDEDEGIPTPIKRLVRKESPTTQAEYFVRLPRLIELEGMCTKPHKDCLEALKHAHQWVKLYDAYSLSDERLIDEVWIEYLHSRWAGDEDHHYPWHVRMVLICSTT